ncbi:MAG TPA: DUF5335 family protein [Tepidisphaeraceae bacterium]|nr:DUF5335 family protein [Tepidisphaeraceae bacterium]
MRTRDISFDQWQTFFDDFSQLHRDEHVNVETLGRGGHGVQSRLRDVPLLGIVPVPNPAQEEWIEVVARDASGACVTHAIARPSRVCVAEESGDTVALQVESADGSVTMVRFEPPRENMPEGFTIS